jgi:hypothetical protein
MKLVLRRARPVPQVDRRALLELLCVDMTETARAQKLGVARSTYYEQLARLRDENILLPKDHLAEGMHCRGRLTYWEGWSAEGFMLSGCDDAVLVLRKGDYRTSFITNVPQRWSTKNTEKYLDEVWYLTRDNIEKLTIAIAHVLGAEALIIPEEME